MKNSVIKDILDSLKGFGNIRMPKVDKEISDKICNTYDELEKKLSPELLNLHQEHVDALDESWADELEYYFEEGLKLGLLLGMKCMEN